MSIGNRMVKIPKLLLAFTVICLSTLSAASARSEQQFKSITGPCNFQFPQDHGPHPGYRTEWWYYTGNLKTVNGERFGFQLTFFRSQMSPPDSRKNWPESPSAWRTEQLYLAHAALTNINEKTFFHAEQMARGALGMAGTSQDAATTSVFLNNWSAKIRSNSQTLSAETDDFTIQLSLEPAKLPVAHGNSGYSLKGRKPKNASCYYSFTRLEATGSLFLQGRKYDVEGLAWMDHEFSSAPLEPDLAGWDWFSLQFSDNTELMIYLLRQDGGGYSPASSGTFVGPTGKVQHLSREMILVETLDVWESPHSAAIYPAKWRIRIKPLKLNLLILPNVADQEMLTSESTRVTYWEGSVAVKGTGDGKELQGVGYVELTGYAKKFDAPM